MTAHRPARRRLVAAWSLAIASGSVSGALTGAAGAQELALKRPPLTAVTVSCPTLPVVPAPVQQQVDEANRLATLGQEAALEGDHASARNLFGQAAQLDPRDPRFAYRLGREDEELHLQSDAIREYCRYLSLAPSASDAADISDRLTRLLPAATMAHAAVIVRQFRAGITHYDARDWPGAIAAFGQVVTAGPPLAAAVYDRALAYDANGDRAAAIRDFDRYLQLAAQAPDAPAVRNRVDALRREIPSATTAALLGILPGGGQFYTHQPLLGAAVVAAVAGGAVLAAHSRTVTRDTMFPGPFGGTYPGTYTQRQHPDVAAGVGIAAGAIVLGAIEAAIVAHGRSAGLSSADTTSVARSAFLPHAGPFDAELPALAQDGTGLRLSWGIRVSLR